MNSNRYSNYIEWGHSRALCCVQRSTRKVEKSATKSAAQQRGRCEVRRLALRNVRRLRRKIEFLAPLSSPRRVGSFIHTTDLLPRRHPLKFHNANERHLTPNSQIAQNEKLTNERTLKNSQTKRFLEKITET